MTGLRAEGGFAVIVAMMGLLMTSALGMSLVLATSTETMIARNFRDGAGAMYAADGVAARAADELSEIPDWSPVLGGLVRSAFADGTPGERTLSDGSKINLAEVLTLANCGKLTTCSTADMNATTVERPWGLNNPRWRLYAYGRLADMVPVGAAGSRFYVVLLVADDPSETDDNPMTDGASPANPGSGVLLLRAEGFGPGGAHGVVELTVARVDPNELISHPDSPPIRVRSWRLGR